MLKYWFRRHFPDYLSGTFLNFITDDFRPEQVKDFIGFLIDLTDIAHGIYVMIGKINYDKYRNEFTKIQLIWEFIQESFGESYSKPESVPYTHCF